MMEQDAVSQELGNIAQQLSNLGLSDAATSMGAIEVLSLSIKEGFESLSNNMLEVSLSLDRVADAIVHLAMVTQEKGSA